MSITTVLLKKKGFSEIKLPSDLDIDRLDINSIKDVFKSTGLGVLERQCDWELDDNVIISLYAWSDGNAGTENKHEMPPPVDNDLFFGDMLILKSVDSVIKSFSKKEYTAFYEEAFGGFENLGDEDSEEDDGTDEYDLNDSFIASEGEVCEGESDEESEFEESDDSEDDSDFNEELDDDSSDDSSSDDSSELKNELIELNKEAEEYENSRV